LNPTMFHPGRHSVPVKMEGVTPGIYLVRLIFDGSEIRTAKMIVQ